MCRFFFPKLEVFSKFFLEMDTFFSKKKERFILVLFTKRERELNEERK